MEQERAWRVQNPRTADGKELVEEWVREGGRKKSGVRCRGLRKGNGGVLHRVVEIYPQSVQGG